MDEMIHCMQADHYSGTDREYRRLASSPSSFCPSKQNTNMFIAQTECSRCVWGANTISHWIQFCHSLRFALTLVRTHTLC